MERLLPDSAKVELNLAALLVSMQRLAEAVPHYERALQLVAPAQSAAVHNNFGIVLAMQGKFDQAIPHFEAAVRLEPDFAAARANLARAQRGGR